MKIKISEPVVHDFNESLRASHAAEDLPFWGDVYRKAFPDFQCMISHRQNGWHQAEGIDRSITLKSSKQILVDEKVRFKDYGDILLEYLSNAECSAPGWVCKPLKADYIAYAIAPCGICYLLPVIQLQEAWRQNSEHWLESYFIAEAKNRTNGRTWTTKAVCVPPNVLFIAIGKCLRISFEPWHD